MKCDVRWLFLIAVLFIAGCGKGGEPAGPSDPPSIPPEEDAPAASNAFPADKATAGITGKVLFEGDPPPREQVPAEKIAAAKDKFCEKHHRDAPILTEDLIVGDDKTIRNVLVYVKSFPQEWTHATPDKTVTIDQKNCTYTPHVVGVMANQPLVVTSSDDTVHNVHFRAKMNRIRKGNLMLAKGETLEVKLRRPELGSAYFKCDIHGWMKSYVGVFDHPFFFVTGDDGSFQLGKLPPGEYEIEAWHETLGTQQQKLTLTDGETATADFTFKQE